MDDLENRQDEINDDDFGQEMVEEGESTGKYDKLLNRNGFSTIPHTSFSRGPSLT